jgi:hypothetical protein
MYALYNTARCVNTAGGIHLRLQRVTTHSHMFPMSYKLLKSVNISQRYNKANLTDILRIFTNSTHHHYNNMYIFNRECRPSAQQIKRAHKPDRISLS